MFLNNMFMHYFLILNVYVIVSVIQRCTLFCIIICFPYLVCFSRVNNHLLVWLFFCGLTTNLIPGDCLHLLWRCWTIPVIQFQSLKQHHAELLTHSQVRRPLSACSTEHQPEVSHPHPLLFGNCLSGLFLLGWHPCFLLFSLFLGLLSCFGWSCLHRASRGGVHRGYLKCLHSTLTFKR